MTFTERLLETTVLAERDSARLVHQCINTQLVIYAEGYNVCLSTDCLKIQ